MNKPISVFVLMLLLTACATVGNKSIANHGDDWPPMDYTKAQLLAELGPPTSHAVSLTDGKTTEVVTWTYAHAEANPGLFIPIVGLFVAASGEGMTGEGRSLAATFIDGKMTGRAWSRHQIGGQNQGPAPASAYQIRKY